MAKLDFGMTRKDYIKMLLRQKQIYQHRLDNIQGEMNKIDDNLNQFDKELVESIQKQIEKEDKECLSALKI